MEIWMETKKARITDKGNPICEKFFNNLCLLYNTTKQKIKDDTHSI